ncbi:hypothetical protein GCM10029964_092490 [Kibdelosporangium lantanae]
MLAVVDGADHETDVRPLVLAPEAGVTVITARVAAPAWLAEGAELLEVPQLPADAAVRLLRDRVGERVRWEDGAVHDLVAVVGRHPHTLCMAAAWLTLHPNRTVTSVVRMFDKSGGSVTPIHHAWEQMMMAALKDLPDDAARLLAMLGALRRSGGLDVTFTQRDAEALLGVEGSDQYADVDLVSGNPRGSDPPGGEVVGEDAVSEAVDDALRALVAYDLSAPTATPGRFRVAAAVLDRPEVLRPLDPQSMAAAVVRLAKYCLWMLARAVATTEPGKLRHTGLNEELLPRFADATAAQEWFVLQRPLLISTFDTLVDLGHDVLVVQLADVLWPMLRQVVAHAEQRRIQLLAAQAAHRLAAQAADRLAHVNSASAVYFSYGKARFAWASNKQGDYDAAVEACTRALSSESLVPLTAHARAAVYSARSTAYKGLGHLQEALEDIDCARAATMEAGGADYELGSRDRRKASILAAMERWEAALEAARSAIELIARDPRWVKELARAVQTYGEILVGVRSYVEAAGQFALAVALYDVDPHIPHKVEALRQLTDALSQMEVPAAGHFRDQADALDPTSPHHLTATASTDAVTADRPLS